MTQITLSVNNEQDAQLLLSLAKRLNLEIIDIQQDTDLTDAHFWNIITLLDLSDEAYEADATIQKAVQKLQTYSERNIQQFQEILSKKLYHLDKKVFAEHLPTRYAWHPKQAFSSDSFLYARASVVAQGKSFYESVLADPSQMINAGIFEDLLYLAETAFETKTGKAFDYIPTFSYETFSNPDGWERTLTDRLTNQPGSSKNAR